MSLKEEMREEEKRGEAERKGRGGEGRRREEWGGESREDSLELGFKDKFNQSPRIFSFNSTK